MEGSDERPQEGPSNEVVVDASGIGYCDVSGIALFVRLRELQEKGGGRFEIRNLAEAAGNLKTASKGIPGDGIGTYLLFFSF
jgi:ABC-type transporter Mla MlaB component